MPTIRTAVLDASLSAVITGRTPLAYADGADATLDRPAHVRAASSIAWIHDLIAVVQDDANFVALVDPGTAHTRMIALPGGFGGLRQFDDERGNKAHKFDLESCVAIAGDSGPTLLAFGSGSTAARRQVITMDQWRAGHARIAVSNARTLYERLEQETDFAGSELNIEGVLATSTGKDAMIRFFGRGNGATKGDITAVNATCDIPLKELLHFLVKPFSTVPPQPSNVTQYNLGNVDGTALTFTDTTQLGASVLYSATAEQSPNTVDDGPVAGSALGVIASDSTVRYALLTGTDGKVVNDKVEGVLMAKNSTTNAYIVIDADDPHCPSELCTVELRGAWIA